MLQLSVPPLKTPCCSAHIPARATASAHDFNAIIEIPMHSEPIHYEADKKYGAILWTVS
jgi:inorganic pyrophosphatase